MRIGRWLTATLPAGTAVTGGGGGFLGGEGLGGGGGAGCLLFISHCLMIAMKPPILSLRFPQEHQECIKNWVHNYSMGSLSVL